MRDTVAIIGSHPGTRSKFDFSRNDCDVWIFNEAYSRAFAPDVKPEEKWVKRCDAVFQMHTPAVWRNPRNRNDQFHADWLRSGNTPPIYMMERYEEVPQAIQYPLDEVIADIGGSCRAFLTSSVALALALAIHCRYKTIEVYGVEMETETEYIFQRDGITYWFGVADGRGVELKPTCLFMQNRFIYGYEGQVTIPYADFQTRIDEFTPQVEAAFAEFEKYRKETDKIVSAFVKNPQDPTYMLNAVKALAMAASQYGRCEGIKQENQRYQKKADDMMAASQGEYLFVRQEFEQSATACKKAKSEREAELMAFSGQLNHIFENIMSTGNIKKRVMRMNSFMETFNKLLDSSVKNGILQGAIEENRRYILRLDTLIRAAGGEKSEQAILSQLREANAVA